MKLQFSGPPDPEFARQKRLNPVLGLVFRLISRKVRQAAKRAGTGYVFLFMQADGAQLAKITELVESGAIKPVVDRVFPFEALNDALAYIETGRAKGKVVIRLT